MVINTCKYKLLCFLLFLLLFPMAAQAQDDADVALHEYIEKINDLCPIDYGDGWGVGSVTMVGDNYALLDFLLPANMTMVLSSFSSNRDNVKQLWIRQLEQYGERWNNLIDLLLKADRRLVINLRPDGYDDTPLITILPSDFRKQ